MSQKPLVINYALSFLGVPYIYGGNNRLQGIDCSGLTCEVLKAVGIIKHQEDYSARQLIKVLKDRGALSMPTITSGCVLFFGKSKDLVEHVAIALDERSMVEAGGGDRSVLTLEAAKERGACVRIRPIRKDLVECLLPTY